VDVLIVGDTVHSHELRHELPLAVPDSLIYLERDGERHVVGAAFEGPRVAALGGCLFHPFEELGWDELLRTGRSRSELLDELAVRAARAFGVTAAVVPSAFPLSTADRLRAAGVSLTPDYEVFADRRRVKTAAELAGIRRAQAAAEAGLAAARELLRRAAPTPAGPLAVDGRPVRCEDLKAEIARAFAAHAATAEDFIVSHGAQTAVGHEPGSGELRAGEPIVIDLWPRDNASSCFADMTRTFVVGDVPDQIARWHGLCREAHRRSLAEVRDGVDGETVNAAACGVFEASGEATQRTKADGETLDHGFFHALGHGVGLAVHEEPLLAVGVRRPLVDGDVISIEPGLYRAGYGGVRIEDLVLVGTDGGELLTDFPDALTP
jgi:Xaa-Pro aminopeptidase